MAGEYDALVPGSYAGYGYGLDNNSNNTMNFGLLDQLGKGLMGEGFDFGEKGLLGGLGDVGKNLSPLIQGYGMYQQWNTTGKYMDMMNEQLGMAKEQWAMTKDEMARIQQSRDVLHDRWNQGHPQQAQQEAAYNANNPAPVPQTLG